MFELVVKKNGKCTHVTVIPLEWDIIRYSVNNHIYRNMSPKSILNHILLKQCLYFIKQLVEDVWRKQKKTEGLYNQVI